ncbi:MAG: flagellar FliJ family protein [Planctomycetaceae bacterium]|jgi:flagellar export protein FliJ|nr:flagellar FliJ family protein [Planctomycetaceae bacterium]
MAFKFRLESVITVRDNILKECQSELAKAYEARKIVEDAENRINAELERNIETNRQKLKESGILDVEYMLGLQRRNAYLNSQLNVVKHDLKQIDEEIERRINAVTEAHIELKTIEKLKEKKQKEYQLNETKKETIIMDEVATTRAINNRNIN